MHVQKVLLATFLALAILSSSLVSCRPHASMESLTEVASDLTHALETIVDRLRSETESRSRRRRYVHFHIGRQNHHPTMRVRYGRHRRYRMHNGGRNPDISDH